MMTVKQICKRCGKKIVGKIRIITYRKKLGSKSINKVEMYDDKCFKIKNKEKAISRCCKRNGTSKQKRTCKKKC